MIALNNYLKEIKANRRMIEIIEEFMRLQSYEYYVCSDVSREVENITDILRVDKEQHDTEMKFDYKRNILCVLKEILNSSLYDLDVLKESSYGVDYLELVNQKDFLIMCINYYEEII